MERLLSLQDVAAATGYSTEAIRRAVTRGELVAEKLCGRWRTTERAVLEWRQANRNVTPAAPTPAARSVAVSAVTSRRAAPGARGSLRERQRARRATG